MTVTKPRLLLLAGAFESAESRTLDPRAIILAAALTSVKERANSTEDSPRTGGSGQTRNTCGRSVSSRVVMRVADHSLTGT